MKVYIAGPMFNEAEKAFNMRVDEAVRATGAATYLPQRDGGEAAALVAQGLDEHQVRQRIYQADRTAIDECGMLVFLLEGRVPDEGACVELGIAIALGKHCVGLQTDCRRFGGTDSNNLMIDYSLRWIARSLPELTSRLAADMANLHSVQAIPFSAVPGSTR